MVPLASLLLLATAIGTALLAIGAMIGYGILAYLILLRVRRPLTRMAITADGMAGA